MKFLALAIAALAVLLGVLEIAASANAPHFFSYQLVFWLLLLTGVACVSLGYALRHFHDNRGHS